ncbi:ARM-repeat/Tetratricopeptide repeat protein [Perilla frutescens var. hirtella]|nr:ARM-repeat/Tetratricopeptide repeat protein [Perilla frutescens var. frutescens]KAH6776291.1 ARM-repeat/Tetratricopeptide repeat protein [Perilla frutescens var. hirtella]
MSSQQICTKSRCFFCIMKEQDSSIRREKIQDYLKGIPFLDDDEELILVVSELWNVAMTRPDDEELPSLGIFECMTSLINKAIRDRSWLLRHQNIYIPYYAAHIVGSYTMNKVDFAVRAVESGVVLPLMELLRGKMMSSWVEKRVAIRALGHLASYEKTFKAIVVFEEEVVKLAMHLASSCLQEVYSKFVGVRERRERAKYQCDLLTRGVGGVEMENRKAEEWASQLQCWSIHLLNCFAVKERSLNLMCKREFLNELSEMWGGLANHTSPAGIGLIRILCYSKVGRESIARSKHVIENLCNISRSSDDWQYMGIDCLLLLLKDPDTRYKVIDVATSYLVDLIELRNLGNRSNVGDAITRALVHDYCKFENSKMIKNVDVQRSLEEIWNLKMERRKREQLMSREKVEGKRAMVKLIKQQGNHKFIVGDIEEAMVRYSEALEICPLRHRNERVVLYSNRAQCNLLLRDVDASISDATRALCLSTPPNSHGGSLWTRSQAYDMKGMAKESLMDCIIFINVCIKSDGLKVPYYAVRMISKQMESTWLFREAAAQMNKATLIMLHDSEKGKELQLEENDDQNRSCRSGHAQMMINIAELMPRIQVQNKTNYASGLSTILEEPFSVKDGTGRKQTQRRINRRSSNKSV